MVPTIGRRVWYWPRHDEFDLALDGKQPFDAGVIFVHPNGEVSLMVTSHSGHQFHKDYVRLQQPADDDYLKVGGYATWMPYQVAQAAKST